MRRTAAERARLLNERGYDASEVLAHMREEGRTVTLDEVRAWLAYREPAEMVEVCGKRMTLADASRTFGVHRDTLRFRMRSGMTAEEAITMAPRRCNAWSK